LRSSTSSISFDHWRSANRNNSSRLGTPYCLDSFQGPSPAFTAVLCVAAALGRASLKLLREVCLICHTLSHISERQAAVWLTKNLSKNECVFTPMASEVNKIIVTVSCLFSIDCSPSTGLCRNLVQEQNHLPRNCGLRTF